MRPVESTVAKARGLLNSDLSLRVVRNAKFEKLCWNKVEYWSLLCALCACRLSKEHQINLRLFLCLQNLNILNKRIMFRHGFLLFDSYILFHAFRCINGEIVKTNEISWEKRCAWPTAGGCLLCRPVSIRLSIPLPPSALIGCESVSRCLFHGLQRSLDSASTRQMALPAAGIHPGLLSQHPIHYLLGHFLLFLSPPLNVMQIQQVFPYKLTARTICFQMCLVHLYKVET